MVHFRQAEQELSWYNNTPGLAALFLILLQACTSKQEVITPYSKPLMEAVYASGNVRSGEEYELFSEGDGRVVDKLVNDGDLVRKGDPIYILQGDQQSARFQIARRNYDQASMNASMTSPVLSELKAALESSKSKMKFDSINYVRYKNLWEANATRRTDYDRMKLTYETSANEFLLYKSRYARALSDVQLARETAQQQLLIATDDSGRNIIRSQMDGKVFFTRKDKGELVRRGESVAIVGKADSFYLELSIDEQDIEKVKPGQQVLVKIDAFEDKVFHASVSKIYSLVDVRQQALRVDAILTDSLPGIFSGLAVEANIVIQQKEKALVIPKAALLKGDSVSIETDDGEKKIHVTPGIETLDEVEITEGITPTSRLIIKK